MCLKRVCHLVSSCLTLCCSLTCRAPRAHLLPHSLFLVPRHQEHALQSEQHDLLQEHPVHHQPLQASLVEKHRYQEEPLWHENQQSDGNLRNTFSTGYEPKEVATKELATVLRISRITDPYFLHRKNLEKKITDLRSPKKRRNLENLVICKH